MSDICADKLFYERQARAEGYELICGVDEVGRGPLAGPVVCAAVILPLDSPLEGVDDSKKLSPAKRARLSEEIIRRAVAYSVYSVDARTVDGINILQATRLCMKGAVESLAVKPDFVLTDGNMTLDVDTPQKSVVKGDAKSYLIGAASIVAKVYRDGYMERLSEKYPQYLFAKNKGYGTAEHIAALKKYGACEEHRRTFIKNFVQ